MNPLPPQAYTKDTLLKAYQWLMSQDASIKDIATSPDILVSLYLKALRDGDSALERPSIKNFKNELKNLAGMMGELDGPPIASHAPQMPQMPPQATVRTQPTSVVYPSAQPMKNPSVVTAAQMAAASANTQTLSVQTSPTSMSAVGSHTQVSFTEKTMTATAQNWDLSSILDCRTLQMLAEVQEEFNLSSDVEALRMLIKVGYNKSKDFLK